MKRVNQNIELKKNHDIKLKLIEKLKDLLHSDLDNNAKYERFLSLRKDWVSIGKVPGHLAFGLNNSYDHQVKVCLLYTSPSPRDRLKSGMGWSG